MKQPIRLYLWLTGMALLLSPGLLAQSDSKSKSRLDMGKKPTPVGRVIHSRNFPFLKHPSVAGLDRDVTVQKHAAINDFYRTLLINPSSARTPARTVVAETGSLVAVDARPQSAEDVKKQDDRMFSNERITVSNIYPNPANDVAEIDYQIAGGVNEAKLLLHNVLGAPIAEYSLDRSERKISIPTRSLTNGVYFYQLSIDGKKVATKKLLVRHQ